MATTVALWHFDETKISQLPAESIGNVNPLIKGGAAVPAISTGVFGKARTFGPTAFFVARGTTGNESKLALIRSLTLEAVCKYTQNGAVQTICARGKDTSTAERRLFLWQLVRSGGQDFMRLSWQRKGGGLEQVDMLLPTNITGTGFHHFACVREWVSATSAMCTAYVDGVAIISVSSALADIDDGLDGEVAIGARWNGAAYVDTFNSDIDEVEISSGVRTPEEIRQRYRRLFYYPALGYQLQRSMLPPGESYSNVAESTVQRELMVEGFGLAQAWSHSAELREDWLPDRAWFNLDRWETLTGNAPLPADSIATRRDRVVSFLRKVHGYNKDQIKSALRETLGLADVDIAIVEASNMRRDDFAAGLGAYLTQEPRAGTITASGGDMRLQSALGTDIRWTRQTPAMDKAVRVRVGLPDGQLQSELAASFTITTLPINTYVGVFYLNLVSGDFEFCGIFNSGANRFFIQYIDQGPILGGTFGSSLALGAATNYWVRLRHVKGRTTCTPAYRLDGAGYDDGWIEPGITSAEPQRMAADPGWFGIAAFSTDAALAAALDVKCTEYRVWVPRWRGVFEWAVYRNPALAPTAYDRRVADATVKRIKPAQTHASVIEALTAIVDSPFSRVDGEPVG